MTLPVQPVLALLVGEVMDWLVPTTMFVSTAITVVGYPLARAWARRIEREAGHPKVPPDVVARLERIEQAVDSIAIEVECISEVRRFTTKLLSARGAAAATARRAGDTGETPVS